MTKHHRVNVKGSPFTNAILKISLYVCVYKNDTLKVSYS